METDHVAALDADILRAHRFVQRLETNIGLRLTVDGVQIDEHGSGTWTIAAQDPSAWSAIVPMCSRPDAAFAGRFAAARLPIWNFCGDKDKPETVQANRDMHAALQRAGANPTYTEYPGVGHNCWDAPMAPRSCMRGCSSNGEVRTVVDNRPLIHRRNDGPLKMRPLSMMIALTP
jgi:pimeloyl-ACP methyl ester carboxylesterase